MDTLSRPLGIADLLDRAVGLYRESFLALFTIPLLTGAAYFAAAQLVAVGAGPRATDPFSTELPSMEMGALMDLFAAQLGLVGLALVLNAWATAALVHAVSRRAFGIPVDWRASFRHGLDRAPYLLVTSLVLWIAFSGALFLFMVPPFVSALLPGGWLAASFVTMVVFLPLAVAVLLLALGLWLHAPAVVVERRGVADALARSRQLMRRRVGSGLGGRNDLRLSVVLIVVPVIGVAVTSLSSAPAIVVMIVGAVAEWIDLTDPLAIVELVEGPLLAAQMAGSALLQPFAVAVTVLFYYDIRHRTEGLDLEVRALELAARPAPSSVGE